jgi:hypothetical protein
MKILVSILIAIGTVFLTIVLGILLAAVIVFAVAWLGTQISLFKKRREDFVHQKSKSV